ncbi:DUF6301 family protein [Actinoplanes oblitus]|uniref:DUF6301 family protein n=1 Tax=Actinoplanes oblitus TaxID=3040509 RepID=A0ABY8WR72_9ACTN|nr:DUF6301 family protein [Actinoplanes oblitus]WIN00149.1 DUF6301 family protein [Actinoplanes oblitus]
MAEWQALDEAGVLRVAQTVLSAEPWLMSASLPEAAAALGWTVTFFDPDYPDLGAVLDAGYQLGPKSGYLSLDDQGRVESILVHLNESVSESALAADAFKQDLFAASASALTGAYGRPTRSMPGERPQLWWQRDSTWLGLITESDAISLQLTPQELMVGEWK